MGRSYKKRREYKILNKNLRTYIKLNLNLILLAFVIVNVIVPLKLISGGTTGLALIIYYLFKIPVAIAYILLNIPIFIGGFYVFGKNYTKNLFYSITVLSLNIFLVEKYFQIKNLQLFIGENNILGILLGSILSGVIIGFIILLDGNTGGTLIISQILEKIYAVKIGTSLIILDILVIFLTIIFLGKMSALSSIVYLIISGKIINLLKYKRSV
ncbi:MAG: YitT family protein [Fusobacterium sp. JB021]|nr:YitT family protein [Fusobacterium sp. JB021]MDP0506119.1 YitT family protein [Fusobacterium sp. JB019]